MLRTSRAILLFVASVVAIACTEVSTDPARAVAIELDLTPLPAIVVGDSLRDTTGAAIPLLARALNSRNQIIPGARITFLAIGNDSGIIEVDSLTGVVRGKKRGQASVVASVGSLQSDRVTIRVTLRPDTLYTQDRVRDTLRFIINKDTVKALSAVVGHDSIIAGRDSSVGVEHYVVRFTIIVPAGVSANTDTTRVHLVNENRRLSRVDTTNSSGQAMRLIRFPRTRLIAGDSVVVEASATLPDGSSVPGSPIRFVIHLVPL